MDVLYAFITSQELRALIEPTSPRPDAATALFNLPDYRVTDTEVLAAGQRRIRVEATAEAGCPCCGAISTRMPSRRPQRLRDIPVAGPVEVVWAKRRFFCDEYLCPRRTFAEETSQVPRRARSTRRLRDTLVPAVIGSGRAAAETASSFGVSWWLVQRALDSAALTLPDVDALAPRMLGIEEHRYRSVRLFRDPATKAWKRYEPWMTTIVDLDNGQVLGIVDGRDSEEVGGLAVRPAAAVAPGRAGRRDRPVGGIPRGPADVAAAHRGLGRRVPPGQARRSTCSPKSGKGALQ